MRSSTINRRQMLMSSAAAAGVTAALQASSSRAQVSAASKPHSNGVILFQGDSITDAGRARKTEANPNNATTLGRGYPMLIGAGLLEQNPAANLRIYNRGISGNKVPDLSSRWKNDCLDLKPTILSILVGVNDIWHKLNGKYDGTVEDYSTGFAALIEQTKKALPRTTIVICEPFALRCGAVNDSWFPEMDQRRAAAKDVATSAGTVWIPFQTMFDTAIAAGTKPNYWAGDGVHPTLAGHGLMARTWREVVGL
ncbi:SGNH/GDSL hydrolase family protein [Adhaeretor mobilis]|uniref:GDSL-like Lipase/Acylhydrolase n=1 Tax=Adhaeretor mobilis TaxID=1930276 RepID=A0A517N1E5_9BACT|nr:SGNH/GDSL hydrolase family protein [Adhaeretor mobilis]QDT00953.1 GDSL-like Lipase/Acylhydrolase [Adhaeretor mobilis]